MSYGEKIRHQIRLWRKCDASISSFHAGV